MKNRSARTGKAVTTKYADANPNETIKVGKSKDTLRLDWIINYRADVWPNQDSGWAVTVGEITVSDKSLRRAIDRAMKGE